MTAQNTITTNTKQSVNPYAGTDAQKAGLADFLHQQKDIDVMRHFLGYPIAGAPFSLDESVIVCVNLEWWQDEPHPTTEIGIAELQPLGRVPNIHAENILSEIRVAHARIIEHAHLVNRFEGAGDPTRFFFGTTKYVTEMEARQVLVNTFCRVREDNTGHMQPVIFLAHDVRGKIAHVQGKLDVNLLGLKTIVKVIDTQDLAKQALIKGPNGPNISLSHLLHHFNIPADNLHTAGNDAGYTMIAAILASLKNDIYGVHLPFKYAFGPPPEVIQGCSIRDVVEKVKAINKLQLPPTWGRILYCTRCGRFNHLRQNCFAFVRCEICHNSGNSKLVNYCETHTTGRCIYQYWALPQREFSGEMEVDIDDSAVVDVQQAEHQPSQKSE